MHTKEAAIYKRSGAYSDINRRNRSRHSAVRNPWCSRASFFSRVAAAPITLSSPSPPNPMSSGVCLCDKCGKRKASMVIVQ